MNRDYPYTVTARNPRQPTDLREVWRVLKVMALILALLIGLYLLLVMGPASLILYVFVTFWGGILGIKVKK